VQLIRPRLVPGAIQKNLNVGESVESLPGSDSAVIDEAKFTHYALDSTNKNGGAEKARVFKAALGFSSEDTKNLINQIRPKHACDAKPLQGNSRDKTLKRRNQTCLLTNYQ